MISGLFSKGMILTINIENYIVLDRCKYSMWWKLNIFFFLIFALVVVERFLLLFANYIFIIISK